MTLFQYPYFHIHFLEGLFTGLLTAVYPSGGLGFILLFIGYEVREYQVKRDHDPITIPQFTVGYTLGLLLGLALFKRRRISREGCNV